MDQRTPFQLGRVLSPLVLGARAAGLPVHAGNESFSLGLFGLGIHCIICIYNMYMYMNASTFIHLARLRGLG